MKTIRSLVAVLAPCCVALAQTCAVKGNFRLVNSVNFTLPSILVVDTGWQTAGPLVAPGFNTNSNGQGCFSEGACATVSDYGYLRVVGVGAASTCGTGHVNLRLDSAAGNEPKAQFRDQLTVVAPGLPNGTPVPLRCSARLVGSANVGGLAPTVTYSSLLYVNGSPTLSLLNSAGTTSVIVNVGAGNTVPIQGQLFATLYDLGVVAGPPNTASFSVDLEATFDITPLLAGVTLASCSGAVYDQLAARATPVGIGCGAAPPALAATAPVLGTTCTLSTTGAPANAPTWLLLALGRATAIPLGACVLQIDPVTAFPYVAGVASTTGQFLATLVVPNDLSLLGVPLTAQALPLQSNGPFLGFGELSNGVELRLGY